MERRWLVIVPVVVPTVLGLVGGILWLVFHSWIVWGWWALVGQRPLSSGQLDDLRQCEAPGWWAMVKALTQDHTTPCGDPWLIDELAARSGPRDRRNWLASWVDGADSTPRQRVRAALALGLQGQASPREPTWLLLDPEVPDEVRAQVTTAVAGKPEWTRPLGPRWRAAGALRGLQLGHMGLEEVAPIVDALWVVDDPAIQQLAGVALGAELGLDDATLEEVRRRRERGLPVQTLPADTVRAIVRHAGCEPRCLPLWVEILRAEAEERGWVELPVARPADAGSLRPWLVGLGGTPEDADRAAWWAEWTAGWVRAGPDPVARLASLLGQGPEGRRADPMAVLWEARGTPWVTAAVVREVGQRAGIPVRVGERDEVVWVSIGGVLHGIDTCGRPVVGQLPPEEWPMDAVVAQALVEAAVERAEASRMLDALRIARAAERLDPLGAAAAVPGIHARAGALPDDFAAAFGIGAALTGPTAAPGGAEEARRARGTGSLSACEG